MFKGLYNTLMENRQRSANMEVARLLQRSEYPNENIEYILDKVMGVGQHA